MIQRRSDSDAVSLYGMLRDVLLLSIKWGVFVRVAAFLVILVVILKMPSKDVARLVFRLLDLAQLRCALGYAIAFVSLSGWLANWKRRGFELTQRDAN
jgi:hypothetical protein